MKKSLQYCLTLLTIVFVTIACATNDDSAVVQGSVFDAQSGNVIGNALVQITAPGEFNDLFARTNENGQYNIGGIEVEGVTDLTLTASATGYDDAEEVVRITPGESIAGVDFEITEAGQDPIGGGGDDGDDGGVTGEPSEPTSIQLLTPDKDFIQIAAAGTNNNVDLTFQVRDAAGRRLNLNSSVEVAFSFLNNPGNEATLEPSRAFTNGEGQVTTNLQSGNTAGPVQLLVEIIDTDISIRPIPINIHGGFPDLDHFSLSPDVSNGAYNFEAWATNGIRNQINVLLGDEFSNPVRPNTAVYFETTGGVIEGSGVGHTNETGEISVNLISGKPRPTDQTTVDGINFGGRDGLATVTAITFNKDNQPIEESINVVFSTSSANITATPTTFDLDPNGGASFNYTVTDLNGNPMAKGTTILIEAGNDIEVTGTGSEEYTLGNNILPGPGSTEFNFSIRDTDDENSDPANLTISIIVTSPSGNTTIYDGINGIRRKGQ